MKTTVLKINFGWETWGVQALNCWWDWIKAVTEGVEDEGFVHNGETKSRDVSCVISNGCLEYI